jgi:hypothetical protein
MRAEHNVPEAFDGRADAGMVIGQRPRGDTTDGRCAAGQFR